MSEKLRVIGIDPGPVPGIAVLRYSDRRLVEADLVQVTARLAVDVLKALFFGGDDAWPMSDAWPMTIIGVERFVTRGRTNQAGRTTLDLVGKIEQLGADYDVAVLQRTAAQVKHWATENRLKKAVATEGTSLLDLSKGMAHARDAARHALFTAVHDGLIPDPLSRKAATP